MDRNKPSLLETAKVLGEDILRVADVITYVPRKIMSGYVAEQATTSFCGGHNFAKKLLDREKSFPVGSDKGKPMMAKLGYVGLTIGAVQDFTSLLLAASYLCGDDSSIATTGAALTGTKLALYSVTGIKKWVDSAQQRALENKQ